MCGHTLIHDARWQADPERRAARGPSTGSGAAASSCPSKCVISVRQTGILLSAGEDCLSADGNRLSAYRDFAMSADTDQDACAGELREETRVICDSSCGGADLVAEEGAN
jgi:hypothetical protein